MSRDVTDGIATESSVLVKEIFENDATRSGKQALVSLSSGYSCGNGVSCSIGPIGLSRSIEYRRVSRYHAHTPLRSLNLGPPASCTRARTWVHETLVSLESERWSTDKHPIIRTIYILLARVRPARNRAAPKPYVYPGEYTLCRTFLYDYWIEENFPPWKI